jgi:hypothetical protein
MRYEEHKEAIPMQKTLTLFISSVLLIGLAVPLSAQKKDPWFHLEVKENKEEPELVKINLPVSMLDVALKIAKDKKFNQGRIKLDSHEISVAEMRQIWSELKKAGNAEFVTVEKRNETVRIAREGNFVLVKVFENKAPKVDLRVPVPVVDALLAGPGDELDIKAALMAMQQKSMGDILTVNDNKTQVRMWID